MPTRTPSTDGLTQADLFPKWLKGLRANHIAHQRAAASFAGRSKVLGVPVIVVTTAIGTTVLANLSEQSRVWLAIAGGLSFTAAILTALQTFLDYAARAEHHQVASRLYGSLRRRAELALTSLSGAELNKEMGIVKAEWDKADTDSPYVPQRFINQAYKRIERSEKAARDERSVPA